MGTACGVTGNLGSPISLDFKDGDVQDIFRLFSDISGLNVVVNPGVTGKVTLKLNEVPWGRALELILKTNGLGCVLEENVIRIAKISDLQREEVDRRKLQDREGARRGAGHPHPADLLRQGHRSVRRPEERQGGVGSRRGERRRAHEHHHHARPARLRAEGQEPDRRARHRDSPGRDRGPDRGHHPQLRPRPRDPVGLRRGGDTPVRKHHEQVLPQRARPERRRGAEQPRNRGRQHRAGRTLVGVRDRHRRPRLRGQPAGGRLQHAASASRWATSSAASTSTWR